MTLADALSHLDGKAMLDAQDALTLRKILYGATLSVTRAEIEALFKLNADAGSVSPEWRDLFVEATTDLVVHQQHPPGYLDEEQATWLINLVSSARSVREDQVEMLIHILEEAKRTPDSFSYFTLELVKNVALASFRQQGRLDRRSIENLKRVIFAQGGERNVAVTRHEAEALFDINDALKGAEPDRFWREFFVHAVAASVLCDSGWEPDAKTELRNEQWLEDTSVHPFRQITSMFARKDTSGKEMREGLAQLLHWDFEDHAIEKLAFAERVRQAKAATITDDENNWLMTRVGRTGGVDGNEHALLAYIRENGRN